MRGKVGYKMGVYNIRGGCTLTYMQHIQPLQEDEDSTKALKPHNVWNTAVP